MNRYYSPPYKTDVFVEGADTLPKSFLPVAAYERTENYALEHDKSLGEILLELEKQAASRQLLLVFPTTFACTTPLQARQSIRLFIYPIISSVFS